MRRNIIYQSDVQQPVTGDPNQLRQSFASLRESASFHNDLKLRKQKTFNENRKYQVSWIWEFLLLLLLIGVFVFIFSKPLVLVEKSRGILKNCPIGTVCKDGKVVGCEQGYLLLSQVCVFDSNREILAREMSLYLGRLIAEENGAAHCQETGEFAIMSQEQAKVYLMNRFDKSASTFEDSFEIFFQNVFDQTYPELQMRNSPVDKTPIFVSKNVILKNSCSFWQKLILSRFQGAGWMLSFAFLIYLFFRKLRLRRVIAEAEKIYEFARNDVIAKHSVLDIEEFIGSFGHKSKKDTQEIFQELERIRKCEKEIGRINQPSAILWTSL